MNNWPCVRLDWVADVVRHTVDPGSLTSDNAFHYSIPALDEIGDGQIESAESIGSDKLLLTGGEVLVSKLNPRKTRVMVAEAKPQPVLASTEFIALVPQNIDPQFLTYWLKSEKTRQDLDRMVQSVTRSHQRIRPELLTKTWVRLPNKNTQRAIADFLDAETIRIDALIAKKRYMVKLLEERDRRMIDECFGPRSGESLVRLARFALVQTGIALHEGRTLEGDVITRPYLRVANVQPGWLDLSEIKSVTVPKAMAIRSRLQQDDVLMTEGGDRDKLGRGTVWRDEIPDCLHQNHVFAVRPDPRSLRSEYLGYLTRTSHARAYFEMTGSQSTNLASTSASKVADFGIPALPIDEQCARVDRYQEFMVRNKQISTALTKQLGLLVEHRQALITAAVTGEIGVPGTAV